MIEDRVSNFNELRPTKKGPVAYWMSRDQRSRDNWALLYAQQIALDYKVPLVVFFCLVSEFLGATIRQYRFMLEGLKQVERRLQDKKIPFILLQGNPEVKIPEFVEDYQVSALVTDFDPLRIKKSWKRKLNRKISLPFCEVDAHNIIPCWVASPKQEYGAYTIRSKIKKLLPRFLSEYPRLKTQTAKIKMPANDWKAIEESLSVDSSVTVVEWIKPGEEEALKMMRHFMSQKLSLYPEDRNDPTKDGVSNLSPYLHFGQVSSQRIALEVKKSTRKGGAYLEELIIRKELADNYCFYNEHYDTFQGFPDWAKKTLDEHRRVPRPYLYSRKQLEMAETHDDLWNAAQMEMVKRGKMHGYMRMYWAKKILEWTPSPEKAQKIAIDLNDKYELDGRDPNGYTGVAWSIGGVHDRAWPERPVFGKVRFMSYNGCRSKFDVPGYIEKINKLQFKSG